MINPNAEGLRYTPKDFDALEKGTTLILHYNLYNKGTFVWVHSHTVRTETEWRATGRCAYDGEILTEEMNCLYEFDGAVCRGSGAEPVCREMPEDCPEEESDDYDDDDRR